MYTSGQETGGKRFRVNNKTNGVALALLRICAIIQNSLKMKLPTRETQYDTCVKIAIHDPTN